MFWNIGDGTTSWSEGSNELQYSDWPQGGNRSSAGAFYAADAFEHFVVFFTV